MQTAYGNYVRALGVYETASDNLFDAQTLLANLADSSKWEAAKAKNIASLESKNASYEAQIAEYEKLANYESDLAGLTEEFKMIKVKDQQLLEDKDAKTTAFTNAKIGETKADAEKAYKADVLVNLLMTGKIKVAAAATKAATEDEEVAYNDLKYKVIYGEPGSWRSNISIIPTGYNGRKTVTLDSISSTNKYTEAYEYKKLENTIWAGAYIGTGEIDITYINKYAEEQRANYNTDIKTNTDNIAAAKKDIEDNKLQEEFDKAQKDLDAAEYGSTEYNTALAAYKTAKANLEVQKTAISTAEDNLAILERDLKAFDILVDIILNWDKHVARVEGLQLAMENALIADYAEKTKAWRAQEEATAAYNKYHNDVYTPANTAVYSAADSEFTAAWIDAKIKELNTKIKNNNTSIKTLKTGTWEEAIADAQKTVATCEEDLNVAKAELAACKAAYETALEFALRGIAE